MVFDRASGILAHPTSFPGPHGIGDLGDGAHRFIDWLNSGTQTYWQIMPLVPPGYGDSPYYSASAFACNPLLISLDWLVGEGLLEETDLAGAPAFPVDRVEHESVRAYKSAKLRRAFDRFRVGAAAHLRPELVAFVAENSAWVADYALYEALKRHFSGAAWIEWEPAIAFRRPGEIESWRKKLSSDVEYYEFEQFLFRRQWKELKCYANDRGVRIIGDIPIFVAHDSADVWGNQDQFRLDGEGLPSVVAGVPPDYFSKTGQLWGNPHYDWGEMSRDGYRWWIGRFRSLLELVDVVRIDHFRAFAAAWVVPYGDETAAGGQWERGPGTALFDVVKAQLGEVPIIVEDLGLITSDVRRLRRALHFPGMAVLQFAFDGDPDNAYLPHNFRGPIVVYTGTHDNQTTKGWFEAAEKGTRRQVQTYIGSDGADIAWDFIRLAMSSTADLAILPLQDVLRFGDEARMNRPGTQSGNWAWRFSLDRLDPQHAAGLSVMTSAYGRGLKQSTKKSYDPYDYSAPKTKHPLAE